MACGGGCEQPSVRMALPPFRERGCGGDGRVRDGRFRLLARDGGGDGRVVVIFEFAACGADGLVQSSPIRCRNSAPAAVRPRIRHDEDDPSCGWHSGGIPFSALFFHGQGFSRSACRCVVFGSGSGSCDVVAFGANLFSCRIEDAGDGFGAECGFADFGLSGHRCHDCGAVVGRLSAYRV